MREAALASVVALSAAAAVFFACGGGEGDTPGGDAGAASSSSSSSGSSSSSSSGSSGDAGIDGPALGWPPPMRAACPSPTVEDGGVITVADGGTVTSVALTWTGAEAAIAYDVAETGGNHVVSLVRSDHAGHTLAQPTVIAPTSNTRDAIALATDRNTHAVCWEDNNETVRCASLPVTGGAVSAGGAGREIAGKKPSLAFDGTSRVLYADGALSFVGPDATLAPVSLTSFPPVDGLVTARSPGFLVVTYYSMSNVPRVRFRDVTSAGVGGQDSEIVGPDLSVPTIAAHGGDALALIAVENELGLKVLPLVTGATPIPFSNTSGSAALVAAKDSYAMFWSEQSANHYVALSTAGATLGTIDLPGKAPFAITAVDDGFLAVSSLYGADLIATHLVCP